MCVNSLPSSAPRQPLGVVQCLQHEGGVTTRLQGLLRTLHAMLGIAVCLLCARLSIPWLFCCEGHWACGICVHWRKFEGRWA